MRKFAFPFVALVAVLGACDKHKTPLEPDSGGTAFFDEVAVPTAASEYSAVVLPPLPGAEYMFPQAISNNGTVVGRAFFEEFTRPVVWEDGQPTQLPLSPWAEGYALDINNNGDIVGHDDELGAVMWTNGELIALGVQTIGSLAAGINQRGEIVGNKEYETSPPEARGFVWTHGQVTELPSIGEPPYCSAADISDNGMIVGVCSSQATVWDSGIAANLELNSDNSAAMAVNSRGQVVGYMQVAENQYHAYVWDDGVVVTLPTLGGTRSSAVDINDAGQIVGTSQTAAGVTHAVLWEGGKLVDLGLAGGSWSSATAINNQGQIVGVAGESVVIWRRK